MTLLKSWCNKHRVLSLHLLMLLCAILSVGLVYSIYLGVSKANDLWMENRDMVSNLIVAIVAHQKAGDEIPFSPDYTWNETKWYWKRFEANSEWIVENTFNIVPMLVYEKASVGLGNYPRGIGFAPNMGLRSTLVAGTTLPFPRFIYINDRYVSDELWNDEAEALEVLVHELVHMQGGGYLSGTSEEYEARTSAATTEVLAALCNQGHLIACRAFWRQIESMARSSLMIWFIDMGRGDIYQKLADLLFRDNLEEIAARKSNRFWAENMAQMRYIASAYSVKPWNELIIPGVLQPRFRLNTGLPIGISVGSYISGVEYFIQGMPFDDSSDLLSGLLWCIKWIGE